MKFLFIGGTWDGQRRNVPTTDPERITVMSIHNPTEEASNFWTVSPYYSYDYELYYRCVFQVAGVAFVVYTHGWMDTALVFQRLLEGYKVVENKA